MTGKPNPIDLTITPGEYNLLKRLRQLRREGRLMVILELDPLGLHVSGRLEVIEHKPAANVLTMQPISDNL